jgi:hypothetical protein
LAPGLGGCGDSPHSSDAAPAGSESAGAATYVAGAELKRQLVNAFDAGLYRLAVMSQPADGATDLGQSLPTGLVDGVECMRVNPAAAREPLATHCSVRWQTVAGRARLTRYLVRLFPTGCFAAGAQPRFPDHRDPTIEGFSEHPLNALVSAGEQCS